MGCTGTEAICATGVALSATTGRFQPVGLWAGAEPPQRVTLAALGSLLAPSLPFQLWRIGLPAREGAPPGALVAIGV